MNWHVCVSVENTCNEVVFEGTYFPLCCITSMNTRMENLEVNYILLGCALEVWGGIVVEVHVQRFEFLGYEVIMQVLEDFYKLFI